MRKPHRHLTAGDIAHITDSALLSFRRSLQKADAKIKAQATSAREADRQRYGGADPIISEHLKSWHDRLKAEGKLSGVNVERLELGLAALAYIMTRDGPVVVPLFEALEKELIALRQRQDTVGRAKRLLESYSGRHPCLSLAPPLVIEHAGVHSPAPQP
jgi:hypothetical protein